MLERVKISAQRLRMLTFEACEKLLELEIDSPNLSSFKYLSLENVFPTIFPKNAPCPFELTFVLDNIVDTLWFLKLREFLVMSNQRKVLKLIVICEEVCPLTQIYLFFHLFSFFNVFSYFTFSPFVF